MESLQVTKVAVTVVSGTTLLMVTISVRVSEAVTILMTVAVSLKTIVSTTLEVSVGVVVTVCVGIVWMQEHRVLATSVGRAVSSSAELVGLEVEELLVVLETEELLVAEYTSDDVDVDLGIE